MVPPRVEVKLGHLLRDDHQRHGHEEEDEDLPERRVRGDVAVSDGERRDDDDADLGEEVRLRERLVDDVEHGERGEEDRRGDRHARRELGRREEEDREAVERDQIEREQHLEEVVPCGARDVVREHEARLDLVRRVGEGAEGLARLTSTAHRPQVRMSKKCYNHFMGIAITDLSQIEIYHRSKL